MSKNVFKLFFVSFLAFFFLRCEKDDICIEDVRLLEMFSSNMIIILIANLLDLK